MPKEPPKIIFSRQFKNFRVNEFRKDLRNIFASNIITDDPNNMWHDWKNRFLHVAEKHAPTRQRRVKSDYKPWLTEHIKKQCYHRDFLKKQAVKLKSAYYDTAYKRHKNYVNSLIKSTKAEYFKTKLGNTKNSYDSCQTINSLLNKKSKTTEVNQLKMDNRIITGDQNIAACFNDYFATIGSKLAENITENGADPLGFVSPIKNDFCFKNINVSELSDTLAQIKTKKSLGIDGISIKLLKAAGDIILDSLGTIFNLSLQTGIYPDDWKLAKVSPIFKDGVKTECGNYRPISVISTIAKLFEKLVCNQLKTYMMNNNIITKNQSGFREHHSTETALLDLTNDWLHNMDNGLLNGVLFLDFKKAFDSVNHNILLSKLELYGIRGTSLKWFRSYLSNRKQICSINGKQSDVNDLKCGVPQGSNLGPFLFLLYINDLPRCLQTTKARLFADDTTLSISASTVDEIESKLNHDLLNVNEWLIANKLTLNETKTEFMIIGSRQRVPSFEQGPIIKLGNQVIKRVPNKKTLGVILNEHLTWNKHIDEQNKKISNNIALLRRAKSFVPEHILNKMYNAFVIPNFYYCSTVWNDGHKNKLTKLSKLQKKAARVITGASYDERSNEIFRKLDWMPIHKSLSIRENIVTFKALTANSPNYLTEMFNFCSNETYNLRSNFCQLFLEKPNTNFLKKSFSYRAAKSWNNLPDNIRQNVDNITLNVAKSMLINHYRTD